MTVPSAYPVLVPRTVFFNANGQPLAGGQVFTYIPNTTTDKITWQDEYQMIQNTNPVQLDGSGSCLLYGTGAYTLVVYDALGNAVPGFDGNTFDLYTNQTFAGLTSSTGFIATGYDAGSANFRAVSANYGVFLRNDNTNAYFLQTAVNQPYGQYNSFRPFYWNLATGAVTIDGGDAGTSISNGLVTTTGNLTAINGPLNVTGFLALFNAMSISGQLEAENTVILGGTDPNPVADLAGNWVFFVGGAAGGYSTSTTSTLTLGTGQTNLIVFKYQATSVGSISTNGTTTAYNTTSDRRLKYDDGEITGDEASLFVDKISPRWFRWKSSPNSPPEPGFFAQQVAKIWPWAVTKPSGEQKYYQLDAGKLIPLLFAEVKSLRKRVAKLEGKKA